MRARNIKPGLLKNEILGSADPLLTILFEGLWMMADREGRLEDRPLRICAEVFPYRRSVTEKKSDTMLRWLHEHGFIVRYEVCGQKYIQVSEFRKHQNPHKNEAPSKIPALSYDEHGATPVQAQDKHQSETGHLRNDSGLFSDSLIPDSLIPPSGYTASTRAPESQGAGNRTEHFRDVAREVLSQVMAIYPKRAGRMNWPAAAHHIGVRLGEGEPAEGLIEGTRRYRTYSDTVGNTAGKHVMDPANFFSAVDKPWAQPWELPRTKAEAQQDANVEAGLAFLRESGGSP